MNNLSNYLPILIPLILLQFGLALSALISVVKSTHFKQGNRFIWIPVVCLISIFGPILYFVFGKVDE